MIHCKAARCVACRYFVALCLTIVAVLLASVSCSPSQVREVTPPVISSGLEELTREENKDRLRELMGLGDIASWARELVRGTIEGVEGQFNNAQYADHLNALIEASVNRLSQALSESLDTQIGPAVRKQIVTLVHEALRTALDEEHRRRAVQLADDVTGAAVRSGSEALARGVEEDFSPAFAAALDQHVGPALERMMRERVVPAIGVSARAVSREAFLGLNEALEGELGQTMAQAYAAFWDRLDDRLGQTQDTAEDWLKQAALGGAGAFGVALLVVVILWRKTVLARIRRDQTIFLLARAIKAVPVDSPVDHLLTRIKQAGGEDISMSRGYGYLSEFLDKNPQLRVSRQDKQP